MKNFDRIRENIEHKLYILDGIEKNIELLKKHTDTELRLYQKNWYFGYHGRNAAWPPTNFSNFPEFLEDPVLQKLAKIYTTLKDYKGDIPYAEKYDSLYKSIEDVSLSLSKFATDIANRAMKEEVYIALLEDRHEILKKAYNLTS